MLRPLTIFILHPSDLLTDHRPHGDGLVAYGFISNIAKRGHRVHVAAEHIALDGPLPSNITIHIIKIRSKHPVVKRIEYALRVRVLFERLSRSTRFDVVHQLNPVHAGLSLGMLGIRVPIVLGTFVPRWPDDADSPITHAPTWRSHAQTLAIAPLLLAQQLLAKALLVVSPAALERFPLHQFFARRIFEVHHGVDITSFSPQPTSSLESKHTVLFLANLGQRKGMYTLLDAFEILSATRPYARLLMAGSGWDEAALVRRIGEMQSKTNVTFLGSVSRDAVPGVMNRAAIYCLPSYGEPYATSVIEAMACGKAVVVTDRGGLRYMLPPGGGVLVPVRDPRALADALTALLDAPDAVVEMGRTNRTFVEGQYTWDAVTAQLEHVYEQILTRKPT